MIKRISNTFFLIILFLFIFLVTKHYFSEKPISPFTVISGQLVAHLGFGGFMPTASFTMEYNLVEWAQLKLGGMGLIMLSGDNSGDMGVLPFAGLNFRF